MLHELLVSHRTEIIARACAKVEARTYPPASVAELEPGIIVFLGQLTETLQEEARTSAQVGNGAMGESAVEHGHASRRRGVTIAQLVHDYGDVCQAVTGLAMELDFPISTDEFRTLNRCLDDAIAQAVTAFARPAAKGPRRLGVFAHELRNLLSTSIVAFEVLKGGTVGVTGSTGALLGRSLTKLRELVDRSLAEVRLEADVSRRQHVFLDQLVEEVEITGMIQATVAHVHLAVAPVEADVILDIDRALVSAVLDSLLANAFNFSCAFGTVLLRTDVTSSPGRVLIEVEDECGGLPAGQVESLLAAFEESGGSRSGLGLGLAIARESIQFNDGRLGVRDLPGKGCVFTVDLPRVPVHVAAAP